MKLNIQVNYDKLVVFFDNVVELINSAIAGRRFNEPTNVFLSGMLNIINDTTGFLIAPKYRNDALYLEVTSLRSIDTAFFIASYSHEISENPYVDLNSVKEKYEDCVREMLEKAKLNEIVTTFSWSKITFEDEPIMLFNIKFDLPRDIQDSCFTELNGYLKEKLKFDRR